MSQIQEKEESVWASALSCLLYFVCDRGKIRRSRLEGLDIRVSHLLPDVSGMFSVGQFSCHGALDGEKPLVLSGLQLLETFFWFIFRAVDECCKLMYHMETHFMACHLY